MKWIFVTATALYLLAPLLVLSPANAALTFFSDRASFDTANPGLPLEDFEAGQDAGPLTSTSFVGSLSSSTDNDVFSPGDVLDGFTLTSSSSGLVFAADGHGGFSTKHITSVLSNSKMGFLFDPTVTAFGIDLLASTLTPGLFWEIQIFGSSSDLLGTITISSTIFLGETIPLSPRVFFGVSSDAETIRQVRLVKPIGGDGFVDNLAFGTPEPVAVAGGDQTVDEDELVTLDGSQSRGDGDPLTSYAWSQPAGPAVIGFETSDPVHPTFTAPFVGGNTTLTFQLIVGDGVDFSDPDEVDITVVNVNSPPIADAGNDSTIKEGATAQLDGSNSFDPESDPITFDWDQVPGTSVSLLPNDAAEKPTFVAPLVAGQTLVFKLVVDDGFEASIPSSGADSSFADTVAVAVVENSKPTADAGPNQTKDEGSVVSLNGSASSDPDPGDSLSFQWTQTGGTAVSLSSSSSATPSFDAPLVAPGGEAFGFALVVTDDDPVNPMSSTPDEVVINVTNINDPPRCDLAVASKDVLWPPNHKMEQIAVEGVSDDDDVHNMVTLEITGVTQDEPVSGLGIGDSSPDAVIQPSDPADTVLIRRERFKDGNGRVYVVAFTADDGFESCVGVAVLSVPLRRNTDAVDDGQFFDSTQP